MLPGCYSSDAEKGSCFIQTLCDHLEKNTFKEHILHLLTFVSQEVEIEYQSCGPAGPCKHHQVFIPHVTFTLIRLWKFSKNNEIHDA